MSKFKILIFALILLIFCVGTAFASDNSTDETMISSDTQDALSTSVVGDDFRDIQSTINNAKENDVIELNGTYSGRSSIKISKSLTIQSSGKAATLDGRNDTRIFYIENGDITFKNIIFTNAVSNKGGAIYSQGNCVFINCTFKNNYAESGGAIYTKASLNVTDTHFENNQVKSFGGAICCDYDIYKNASKSKYGNVNIKDSTFINNAASRGGAVEIDLYSNVKTDEKYASVNIGNCEFSDNWAQEFGGAIDYIGSTYYGKLIIDKSNFTQNFANEGTAIDISDCKLTLTNSNFSKNTGYYGAVYVGYGCKAEIKNCSFLSNSADAVSAIMVYSSEASLVDCKFTSNSVATISSYYESVLKITKGKSTTTYKKDVLFDNSLKSVVTLSVIAKDFTTFYDSGEKFTIQLVDKNTKKPIKYFSVILKFTKGKKVKTYSRTTTVNGKVSLNFLTGLAPGTYTVTYVSDDWGVIDSSKHTVTIKKSKATVKAPKVTNKYKKSKYFKITLKDKLNNPLDYVKVKVKVFTGKKSKTYTLETDYYGVAKLNTKKLKKGSHKVEIMPGDNNYKFSAKSKIKIK